MQAMRFKRSRGVDDDRRGGQWNWLCHRKRRVEDELAVVDVEDCCANNSDNKIGQFETKSNFEKAFMETLKKRMLEPDGEHDTNCRAQKKRKIESINSKFFQLDDIKHAKDNDNDKHALEVAPLAAPCNQLFLQQGVTTIALIDGRVLYLNNDFIKLLMQKNTTFSDVNVFTVEFSKPRLHSEKEAMLSRLLFGKQHATDTSDDCDHYLLGGKNRVKSVVQVAACIASNDDHSQFVIASIVPSEPQQQQTTPRDEHDSPYRSTVVIEEIDSDSDVQFDTTTDLILGGEDDNDETMTAFSPAQQFLFDKQEEDEEEDDDSMVDMEID